MQWSHLLAKLSPERVQPILREGLCKPPADYNSGHNMPFDHHDSPPGEFDADDHQEERSSIGNFSLLSPPMSHRQPHNYPGPQPDPHHPQSFLDGITTSYDAPVALATTPNPEPVVAPSALMHGITHTDYSDGLALPNPHPPSPHPAWMHGQAPLPDFPLPQQQALYRDDGYAPAENLPPQNYISTTRIAPSSGASHILPGARGVSLFLRRQGLGVSPPALRIQTAVVPRNSELARSPRFTFAPAGAYVPADPIVYTTAPLASPKSAHSFRDKGKTRFDRNPRRVTQEESLGRARSHSWTVVSSVVRRISGRRHPGPGPLITDASPPPQLTDSDWRDLAHWAFRPTDHSWGERFASHVDIAPSTVDPEAISTFYDHSLPPLPSHLSHLLVPAAPLLRTNSSTSALNPFLIHRHTGVPPISWDLRTSARSVFFPTPSSGPGGPAMPSTPMAPLDYAQPATWPPCGALRVGAIGGRASVWPWPMDVRNPAGVRCGDLFRALVENLHQFVRSDELADMPMEQVTLATAACAVRTRAGLPNGSLWPSDPSHAAMDGIRRVDLLLGHTQFCGLVPGPSPGEWTMYVGVQ